MIKNLDNETLYLIMDFNEVYLIEYDNFGIQHIENYLRIPNHPIVGVFNQYEYLKKVKNC